MSPTAAPDPSPAAPAVWCVLGRTQTGEIGVRWIGSSTEPNERSIPETELAAFIAEHEAAAAPRWVWSDTASWYPPLLAAGVRVERCHDLRLCHTILKLSTFVRDHASLAAETAWDAGAAAPLEAAGEPALFDLEASDTPEREAPNTLAAAVTEFARQQTALSDSSAAGRLRFLLAAESAGALIAVEMATAGLPWDTAEHDRILTESLGPRPAPGAKPARMLTVAEEVRVALGDRFASVDSPPKLLRALREAGIAVDSTSKWELAEHDHPAIEPLLRYKKLARLFTANGWAWLDEWVSDGRYRPVYVPGGVVTGRWASSGGGALQLPRQLRSALRADPGWRLISADVAQLEPRALAAMSGDRSMADAGRGTDLYAGIVASGIVPTRDEAKIAVLGALYGATTGDSGRLVPRLRRIFPAAMALVDRAAAVGEHGGQVTTWLGRSSPPPAEGWRELQARASLPGAGRPDEERARRVAKEQGRFTRNFVVQGTAAEWALVWLAELRIRLWQLPVGCSGVTDQASGPVFSERAHLVFFLHDEVIVHAPADLAEAAAAAVSEAADAAGRLLFGDAPVDFPLDLSIVERAVKH